MRTALSFLRMGVAVLSVQAATGVSTAWAAADNYEIDASHSAVIFKVKHLGVSNFYGRFTAIAGKVVVDDADAAKSSLLVEIKAESIKTDEEKRDQHLKSPDFFNVKQFPVITFASKQVKALDKDTLEVAGELTCHGVTKPLTAQLVRTGAGKDPWGGYRVGYETLFTIKRSDFGINYMPEGLGDDVQITVSIEAVKK